MEQCLFDLFWDERDQEIPLQPIAPLEGNAAPATLTDDANFLVDSVKVADVPKDWISRLIIHYAARDYTDISDGRDFAQTYIKIDSASEGANQFNRKAIKTIKSRWFDATNAGQVAQMAGRLFVRFGGSELPRQIRFSVDKKDNANWTGTVIDADTRRIQDETGANQLERLQIVEVSEDHKKERLNIVAISGVYDDLSGFIGPNTLVDRLSESDANKLAYGFICLDTGLFADGESGKKII